jgi:glycosyltransferase involved in cell wall biosynthesis
MISFCIMVYNRWSTLEKLLATLNAQISRDFEVIIVDLGSKDVDLKAELPKYQMKSRLAIHPIAKGGKINRSAGRNLCVKASRAGASDILCFVDADMLVPNNFCQLVAGNVAAGTCFFPICYSLHEGKPAVVRGDLSHWRKNAGDFAHGWWRKEGWGNFAILRSDYEQLGAWNEKIGQTYGGEDNEIRDRAHKLFKVRRFNCTGFFHQWHPPNR